MSQPVLCRRGVHKRPESRAPPLAESFCKCLMYGKANSCWGKQHALMSTYRTGGRSWIPVQDVSAGISLLSCL